MKKLYTIPIVTLLLIAAFVIFDVTNENEALTSEKRGTINSDSTITVTIAAVGDLMCHSTQYKYAYVEADSYNFVPVYEEMMPYFNQADLLFGNFETTLSGKAEGYSGYPRFNSPDAFGYALKEAGFDLLSTTNNHCIDRGKDGLLRTLSKMVEFGIPYIGTYSSPEDSDSIRIFDLNGLTIAFLAYSYGTNGHPIPKGHDYLVNLIDEEQIEEDIKNAKLLEPDIVTVYFHYGSEYKTEPTSAQKSIVKKTIGFGADIILGGHPHVLQPVDYFKTEGGNLDTGFVAYSLGNFVSNQRKRYRDAGVVLYIDITKNMVNDSVYISDVRYLPTWVFKGNIEGDPEYRILPAGLEVTDSTYTYLTNGNKAEMRQALDDTQGIIEMYSDNIKLVKPGNTQHNVSYIEPQN